MQFISTNKIKVDNVLKGSDIMINICKICLYTVNMVKQFVA